jgi:hypothetical protein
MIKLLLREKNHNGMKGFVICLVFLPCFVFGQENYHLRDSIKARNIIFYSKLLLDNCESSVINNRGLKLRIEKDDISSLVEMYLFKIYGKQRVKRQRPYRFFKIGCCWVIWGTLKSDQIGGAFHMIINSTNGQVLYINHGK